ncbi:phage major tail tube protein [Francisella sp. SYW-9]|uniref:phage major tail tube protein n=1 Tax=Francisella sp. SYW-9 TaxID=2610888 RepID=UPI00123CD0CA|nr:phage major tail tube protein [Francisella sp. SYW-9]
MEQFNGQLLNSNCYINGANYLGIATKVTLPKLTPKYQEQNGIGLSTPIDYDTGKLEKMSAVMVFDGIQQDIYSSIGTDIPMILRGVIRTKNKPIKVIAEMRGSISIDNGDIDNDSVGQTTVTMTLKYYRLNFDGKDVVEIDSVNGIRKINGKNQLPKI